MLGGKHLSVCERMGEVKVRRKKNEEKKLLSASIYNNFVIVRPVVVKTILRIAKHIKD